MERVRLWGRWRVWTSMAGDIVGGGERGPSVAHRFAEKEDRTTTDRTDDGRAAPCRRLQSTVVGSTAPSSAIVCTCCPCCIPRRRGRNACACARRIRNARIPSVRPPPPRSRARRSAPGAAASRAAARGCALSCFNLLWNRSSDKYRVCYLSLSRVTAASPAAYRPRPRDRAVYRTRTTAGLRCTGVQPAAAAPRAAISDLAGPVALSESQS